MSPKLGGVEIITCWCVPVDSYFLVPDGQSLCEWPNCPHGAKDRPSAAPPEFDLHPSDLPLIPKRTDGQEP